MPHSPKPNRCQKTSDHEQTENQRMTLIFAGSTVPPHIVPAIRVV